MPFPQESFSFGHFRRRDSRRPSTQLFSPLQTEHDRQHQLPEPGPSLPASSRASSDEDRTGLQDIEKAFPLNTVPSLRLQQPFQLDQNVSRDTASSTPEKRPSGAQGRLPLRPRLAHFTWAWYTLTMSTGGLSLLIFSQPHQFSGLRQIGLTVYILNLVLFTAVTATMLARFILFPSLFLRSITHKREGLFVPTFFLSIATLITSTQRYCVPEPPRVEGTPIEVDAALAATLTAPGLTTAIYIAFWTYLLLSTAVAIGQYSYIFSVHSFGLQTMMPTWILPIFPIMLSGTIAAVIADSQPPQSAIMITAAGLTYQGLGLSVAFMMYAHMVGRLMQSGLPDREHRTGLFMCVGPPAFTALAFLGMARALPESTFAEDMYGMMDVDTIKTIAVVGAAFLWALSFWWFGIAVLAVVRAPPRYFHLGWWAAVFPNTGFVLATIALGEAFRSEGVKWLATGMSICLLGTYLFVLGNHVRAVVVQEIMYPGRDEDVEDH